MEVEQVGVQVTLIFTWGPQETLRGTINSAGEVHEVEITAETRVLYSSDLSFRETTLTFDYVSSVKGSTYRRVYHGSMERQETGTPQCDWATGGQG